MITPADLPTPISAADLAVVESEIDAAIAAAWTGTQAVVDGPALIARCRARGVTGSVILVWMALRPRYEAAWEITSNSSVLLFVAKEESR